VSSRVTLAENIIETQPISFEITLLPPVPAFVSPPIQIQRKPPLETNSDESGEISLEEFLPMEESLTVVFDFPDGRKRSFVRTALFVDGILVAENTAPPFDHFTWNLRGYNTDSSHLLRIEATDSLGIVGSSIEIPVNISILKSKPSPGQPSSATFRSWQLWRFTLLCNPGPGSDNRGASAAWIPKTPQAKIANS
jgi:hypothetical protein